MSIRGVTIWMRPVFRPGLYHLVKRPVILRPAVGVAGTVLFDRSNVHLLSSQDLSPAYGDGQEVGVAKGHIGHGNVVADGVGLGNRNPAVGQCRSADGAQGLIADDQPIADFQAVANGGKRLPLAVFGWLSVADVDGSRVKVANCKSGADAGIHASAEQDDGAGWGWYDRLRQQMEIRSACILTSSFCISHSLHGRVPDELVKLQPQTSGNIVREHPFGQFARIEQTVRSVLSAAGVFGEGRRKQYCVDPACQIVAGREVPGELVVSAVAQYKFDFVRRS